MIKVKTSDIHLKRAIYHEIINDRIAKVIELKLKSPLKYSAKLDCLRKDLYQAYRNSLSNTDNDYFAELDELIISVDAEIVRAKYLL